MLRNRQAEGICGIGNFEDDAVVTYFGVQSLVEIDLGLISGDPHESYMRKQFQAGGPSFTKIEPIARSISNVVGWYVHLT
jgi:hypothetical protein